MGISRKIILTITVLLLSAASAEAQNVIRKYKNTPDFDSADYSQHLNYMTKPGTLTGQTLYLENVSDQMLDYFFTGSIGQHEKGDKNKVTFYKLSRMSKEKLESLKGAWFVVEDYVSDHLAYNRVYKSAEGYRDFNKMRKSFLKLLVGNTTDTIFYNYQNFYNQYHFPFTPISYYNSNKNGYPTNANSYNDLNLIKYDTNANYALVPDQLIGQKLTLPVVTDATLERLYNGTRLYNYSDASNKYSFTDYPLSKGKRLEGVTFTVKGVAFDADNLTNVYLKLVIDNRKDTIFYRYPTKTERSLFPFVVESYYNKMRKQYKDMEFTVRGDKFPLSVIDLRRKRALTLHQGDVFHCLDFVVKDGKFQMLMRNEKGRKFYMPEDYALGDRLSFDLYLSSDKVEKYRTTYPTAYKAILNKELVKGMTMDMAEQSWGKPEREVITNPDFGGTDRHWFYMGNIYIIYKNNVLNRVAIIPAELR